MKTKTEKTKQESQDAQELNEHFGVTETPINNHHIIKMRPTLWSWECPFCSYSNDEEDHIRNYIECQGCKRKFSKFEVGY